MWMLKLQNGVVDTSKAVELPGEIVPDETGSHRKQQIDVLQRLYAKAKESGQTVCGTVAWTFFHPGRFYVTPEGDWLQEDTPLFDSDDSPVVF